jgi:hypothetical protein
MARNSDTYIYTVGSSPNTRVAISQKNRVLSKPAGSTSFKQVGVLSTFDYSESRGLDPVRGVGFGDKIAELVPGVTEPMSLTLNRTLLYTAGIVQELGYKGGVDGIVRSLRQHKWPFDIQSELVFSELVTQADANQIGAGVTLPLDTYSQTNRAIITVFLGCWLNSYSVSFPSDSAIVMEDAAAMATDVTDGSNYQLDPTHYGDLLNSGNNPYDPAGSGSLLFARGPTAG